MTIEKGEFVFLIGPSGSGKSTFLQLMLREETPTSGDLYVADYHVNRLRGSQVNKLRQRIGYVFQDFRLLPKKTVYENVAFALEVIGKRRSVIDKQVPATLDMVGLAAKGDRMPGELSGGEQQRVAIARALITKPAIILADEPTGNLDSKTSAEVLRLIKRTSAEFHQTVVMITHNNDIARLSDRIVRIEDGKIMG